MKGKLMSNGSAYLARTTEELAEHALRPEGIVEYGDPRKVWVEDGHVLVEGTDGKIVRMSPEVAIKLGRTISEAGAESLINKVMEDHADRPSELPFHGRVEP